MAYPHTDSKSTVTKVVEFFTGGIFTSEKEVGLPDQNVMQSAALKLYLQIYRDILCEFKFSNLNAQSITEQIMCIFHSLRVVQHCVDNLRWGANDFRCTSLSEVELFYLSVSASALQDFY